MHDVYVFFECSRGHLDLHSFPTRRSSDLHAVGIQPPHLLRQIRSSDGREDVLVGKVAAQDGPRGVDRKSTRLNSSHSQISYAVFCLKKKNTKSDKPGSQEGKGQAAYARRQ